jgi:DNA invertase Pin-like site-specific DNA recombinase
MGKRRRPDQHVTRAVGYLRVSTSEQADSGAGLAAQRSAIEAEVARRGWTLVAIEVDTGSGKRLGGRPGLTSALEAVSQGRADVLVVAKLDRLSRSLVDFAGLLVRAQEEAWNLVALDLGVDLSTPAGEFLASVMASAAQWERRIIGTRTREALEAKRASGVRLGRPSLIDPALRLRIKAMRDVGQTLQSIADELNDQGVATVRGSAGWRTSSVSAALKVAHHDRVAEDARSRLRAQAAS